MNNIYYFPEHFGLEKLVELDEDLSYEYNTFIVVRHLESRRLFFAQDSGCSCPTPFEDYHFNSPTDHDIREIEPHNFGIFEDEVNSFPVDMAQRQQAISVVRLALKEVKPIIT